MKKEYLIIGSILAIVLAWWFRYDTHCAQEYCISYDRFTMNWIMPYDVISDAEDIKREVRLKKRLDDIIKYKNVNFDSHDYKKAIMDGATLPELIDVFENYKEEERVKK